MASNNKRLKRWRRIVAIESNMIDHIPNDDIQSQSEDSLNDGNHDNDDGSIVSGNCDRSNSSHTSSSTEFPASSEDEEMVPSCLAEDLSQWAMSHRCSHTAVNDLLQILRSHEHTLNYPKMHVLY